MKVLWVHSEEEKNIKYATSLIEPLSKMGINIELYHLKNFKKAFFKNFIQHIYHLNSIADNFDIIHSQYGSGCGYIVSKIKTKAKKYITLRGSDWYSCKAGGIKNRLYSILTSFLTRRSLSSYDQIIAVSKRMQKEISAYGFQATCLPSGIDLNLFKPMEKYEARSLLGQEKNKNPWMLSASFTSNNPVKRIYLIKQAYKYAKKTIPNLELKLLNNISHDDIPYYMSSSDVFVLASTHEGWPNVIKEAMACNLPFVSTDVSDLYEIAEQESICKITAPTADDIAKNIIDVLSIKERPILRKYVIPMDINNIAKQLHDLYRKNIK